MMFSKTRYLMSNVFQKWTARSEWKPQDEYGFYHPNEVMFENHLRRIRNLEKTAYNESLDLMKGIGILDRDLLDGQSILDLGSGESIITAAIAKHFSPKAAWAMDAVPKQIWAAAYTLAERLPAANFIVASAYDLPFPDGSFDVVVMSGVMHHLPQNPRLYDEIFRVMAPGGRFYCQEPNSVPWIATMHEQQSPNERAISMPKVIASLQGAGFEIEEKQYRWARMNTTALGILSPSYRIRARVPGQPQQDRPAAAAIEGRMQDTGVPGLKIDGTVDFLDDAQKQLADIKEFIARTEA